MFKRSTKLVMLLLAGSVAMSSCVGSFSLFNKLASWNKDATSSKLLNEIIFLVISPAYGVCSVVDAFVLNTIEFWTGDNPIAATGKPYTVQGQDGKLYTVQNLKNGYCITAPTGEKTLFVHDAQNDSWSMIQNGVTKELFRFNGDGTATIQLPDGNPYRLNLGDSQSYAQLKGILTGQTTLYAQR